MLQFQFSHFIAGKQVIAPMQLRRFARYLCCSVLITFVLKIRGTCSTSSHCSANLNNMQLVYFWRNEIKAAAHRPLPLYFFQQNRQKDERQSEGNTGRGFGNVAKIKMKSRFYFFINFIYLSVSPYRNLGCCCPMLETPVFNSSTR